MAGDLATMKARVIAELVRPDLSTQVAAAISDAILAYSKQRFRFSDITPLAPPTFPTVVGQAYYDRTANANIGSMMNIDYVLVNIGTTVERLTYETPAVIKQYNQLGSVMQGTPTWYSYEGNTLMFAPVPSGAYLITLGLFINVAAPASDAEVGNPWMVDAERMIRARAKYIVFRHVTRNKVMAEAMSPDPPALNNGVMGEAYRAFLELKGEGNRVTGSGQNRVRPMQF